MPRRDRPSEAALAAWEAFLRSHLEIVDRLDRDLVERHGLPLVWYDVLVQLHDAGGEATMGELADRLLISPSTCTRMVERMAAAGLVERRVDEVDGRVRHARLTREGAARFKKAAVTHLTGIRDHFARFLTDDEAAMLVERFDRMRRSTGSAG